MPTILILLLTAWTFTSALKPGLRQGTGAPTVAAPIRTAESAPASALQPANGVAPIVAVELAGIRPSTRVGKIELGQVKLEIRERLPEVARINVVELAERLAEGDAPLLVDAREKEEYALSHLPGARQAATVDEASTLLEGIPKDREIVVYCSVGYRSGYLAAELGDVGFTNVRNLEGSIFEWANTGQAVYRGDLQVHEVHPYNKKWGRLLDARFWSAEK